MLRLLRFVLSLCARVVLSLRYRIRVHGREKLQGLKGPILVLPTHPAYIDPVLVMATLWPDFPPRPLLYEGHFRNPLLSPFPPLLDAISVPDLGQTSHEASQRAQQAIQSVID